jgi:hypothetical protein
MAEDMEKKDLFSQVREALPQRREPSNEELTPIELLAKYRVTPTTVLPPMGTLFKVYDIPCFYRVFMWSKLQKTSQFTKKMTKNSLIFCVFCRLSAVEIVIQTPPC